MACAGLGGVLNKVSVSIKKKSPFLNDTYGGFTQ